MKVSFRYSYRDLIAFNFYQTFRSPIIYIALAVFIVIGIKPNWQAVMEVGADHSLPFRIIVFVIMELIPVTAGLFVAAILLLLGNISKMNKTVLTDSTITLSDEFILTESAYSRSELQWTAIRKLVRTRSYIFLYITQHGAMAIPKRAFANDEAYDQFWAACQAGVKAFAG